MSMENFIYLPHGYIPSIGTQAYKLLSVLSDCLPHPKRELLLALEDDPRSALQILRGECCGFWLIHNLGDSKGIYQLDYRHLSGSFDSDQEARSLAAVNYWQRSKLKSEQGVCNLAEVTRKLEEARGGAEAQLAFGFVDKKGPAKTLT